jgi:hypothetical protein
MRCLPHERPLDPIVAVVPAVEDEFANRLMFCVGQVGDEFDAVLSSGVRSLARRHLGTEALLETLVQPEEQAEATRQLV